MISVAFALLCYKYRIFFRFLSLFSSDFCTGEAVATSFLYVPALRFARNKG